MAQIQVLKDWNGKTLIEVLVLAFSISKNKAKELLDRKAILVNTRRIWIAKHIVRTGDTIEAVLPAGKLQKKNSFTTKTVTVLYEDEFCLVVSKPAGLVTNGNKSFEEKLQAFFKNKKYRAIHRLDRDTSGALLVAKDSKAFDEFVNLFKDKKIEKIYRALLGGVTGKQEHLVIDTPLEGKTAHTEVWIKKKSGTIALAEIKITTGRTHQIRKHLHSKGMQLLGDREYEIKSAASEGLRSISRQMLHAYSLAFPNLENGKKITCAAPYAEDFLEVMNRLF